VSRPTLRQAAALVAQEQLIEVRRGFGGGYFATRPTARAVSHMAAIFLQSRAAKLQDIVGAILPVQSEMARLAAVRAGPSERLKLEAYLAEQSALEDSEFAYRDFLRMARTWEILLGEICCNPVLALYLRILIDLAAQLAPDEDIYIGRPERAREFLAHQRKVAEAILDGDPEMAMLASRRSSERAQRDVDTIDADAAWPLSAFEHLTAGRRGRIAG
jgi:DNA-binding FadR family transcriptional regulator